MNSYYTDHVGLYRRKLRDFLPQKLFDAHIHIGRKSDILREFSPQRQKIPLCTFSSLNLEELDYYHQHLFSGKTVEGGFVFPLPLREVDWKNSNRYVQQCLRSHPAFKGFLWSNPADQAANEAMFGEAEENGTPYFGIKPYYDLTGKSNFDCTLMEVLPEAMLKFADRKKLAVMLHTTGRGIGDAKLREDLKRILDGYPEIRLILAHMGRHLCVADFTAFFESGLAFYPQLYLETSSSSEAEIYRMVLQEERLRGKLIFGADLPYGLITGVEEYTSTGGAVFRTRDRYTWSEKSSYGHTHLTYNTYHTIDAIKQGVESLNLPEEADTKLVEDIFLRNAQKI